MPVSHLGTLHWSSFIRLSLNFVISRENLTLAALVDSWLFSTGFRR